MSFFSPISLLLSGMTIALALSFLVITLWQDVKKPLNQLFAVFLILVAVWNVGVVLLQAAALIQANPIMVHLAISLIEMGFTGSSIAIYALTAILVGIHMRQFRGFALLGVGLLITYQILLIFTSVSPRVDPTSDTNSIYQPQVISIVFYLIFDGATFYLAWRYRRKIRSQGLIGGIMVFVLGQAISLFNPALGALSLAINVSSIAALVISFAILRREIINPLAEHITQIEAMHTVSLAISSQISLDTVLDQIATQAVGWLEADASIIFMQQGNMLHLATVYNLPRQYVDLRVPLREGIAGEAVSQKKSIHIENYARDWRGSDDLPLARETFGSVICIPLIYGAEAIGALMVIAGQQGRMFNREDVGLLEMLGAQAAVAVTHSQLFADQQQLTREVEAAHSQLETLLTSMENPVMALDRRFRVIFMNPAAEILFPLARGLTGSVIQVLPRTALPLDYREAIRALRQQRSYIYEINLGNKFYLCHITSLGRPQINGWVAILNDITQLKELDRIKSEMVRMTSHDLKNPIQAAMANLELLRDDLDGMDDPEVQISMDTIDKQLNRMNRIISGILDLERVRNGMQLTEICRPAAIITHAVEEMQHLAVDNQIHIVTSVEPDIPSFQGDPEQFGRAIINLLENAIKFTPPGGEVGIRVFHEQNTHIVFEVWDTGIGIPQDMHSQIFDRFFRGRQKGVEHVSGSGLGLSLVRTIVDYHLGTIALRSKEGEGTTFWIRVPTLNIEQLNNLQKRGIDVSE